MLFYIVLVESLKSSSVLIQISSATSWKRRLSIKPTFDVQWWFDILFWNKFGSPKPLVHRIRLRYALCISQIYSMKMGLCDELKMTSRHIWCWQAPIPSTHTSMFTTWLKLISQRRHLLQILLQLHTCSLCTPWTCHIIVHETKLEME